MNAARFWRSGVLAALCGPLFSATLGAQPVTVVKPYFLLITDTSGSMDAATGPTSCRNSCGFTCNRINDAACALQHLADGVGDAVFGLATYPLRCSNALYPSGGHYAWAPGFSPDYPGCGSLNCRDVVPASVDPMFGNTNLGCSDGGQLQVRLYEGNQNELRSWGDGSFTSCTSTTPVPGGFVGGPELSTNGGGFGAAAGATDGRDPRALTPLGGSLRSMRAYLESAAGPLRAYNLASGRVDPYANCRPYNVILLTDGDETCVTSAGERPAQANARRLSCLAVDLNGNGTIENPNAAGFFEGNVDADHNGDCYGTGEQRAFRVRTYVIGFGFSCATATLENIARSGGTLSPDTDDCGGATHRAFYATNEAGVSRAINRIIVASALRELCNGVDDNCNGMVDEGYTLGAACSAGVGQCRASGVTVCAPSQDNVSCNAVASSPSPENTSATCRDGVDNDCDERTDCADPDCFAVAVCGPCVALTEVCDGRDNDCDGLVDEGSISRPCGINVGACTAGVQVCLTQTGAGDGTARWGACSGRAGSAELCDGVDNDCNGAVDDGDPGAGGACTPSAGVCPPGVLHCVGGRLACTGSRTASPEVCDGVDNNCNGATDEGNPGGGAVCGTSVGTCRPGTVQCTAGVLACAGGVGPSPEVCDGVDNNCNGTIDDGVTGAGGVCDGGLRFPVSPPVGTCRQGTNVCRGSRGLVCEGAVGPTAEICDGVDNDCDGVIDNGLGAGAACGSSVGACRPGATRCVGGRAVCSGQVGPTTETCNNIDDDCDGTVDEGLVTGGPCVPEGAPVPVRGQCVSGVFVCRDGRRVCDGGRGPTPEVCDGLDNNCDGRTDEGDPGAGGQCGSTVGACRAGVFHCRGGRLVCEGSVQPSPEQCDCTDNDCDGRIDNPPVGTSICGNTSTGPGVCATSGGLCGCYAPCPPDEGECPPGRTCRTINRVNLCVGDLCAGVTCPVDNPCINGRCTSRCEGVNCAAPLVCQPSTGRCIENSCRALENCPAGQICRDAQCRADRCLTVSCPAGQACYDGTCAPSCNDLRCPAGQTCRRGQCAAADCPVPCDPGQVCNPSTHQCQLNTCTNLRCPRDLVCDIVTNLCADDPCAVVRCPGELACVGGECLMVAPRPPAVARDRAVAAGGGVFNCTASLPRRSTAPPWLLLFAVCAVSTSLRRRSR